MVNLTISTKSGLLFIHIDLSYRILEPDNTVLVYAFVSHIYKLALRIFFEGKAIYYRLNLTRSTLAVRITAMKSRMWLDIKSVFR